MLNVPDLERRWKRYRRSKQIPYVAGTAVIFAGAAVISYLYLFTSADRTGYTTSLDEQKSKVETVPSQAQPSTLAENSISQEARTAPDKTPISSSQQNQNELAEHNIASQPDVKQPTKLSPSMHFMNDFESDVMDYYFSDAEQTEPKEEIQPAPVRKTVPAIQPTQTSSLPSITPRTTVPPAKEIVLNTPPTVNTAPTMQSSQETATSNQMVIQRDDDMKDIQDVIARFKKNKNPALSLFVAKRYYKIGNYQQAYNYALITNELDNNIEDSWLIFAQSLYKLDQKDMAIKTLKTYIQESSSVKAKITLDQMEKGTF